jgi:hypothetical protein
MSTEQRSSSTKPQRHSLVSGTSSRKASRQGNSQREPKTTEPGSNPKPIATSYFPRCASASTPTGYAVGEEYGASRAIKGDSQGGGGEGKSKGIGKEEGSSFCSIVVQLKTTISVY